MGISLVATLAGMTAGLVTGIFHTFMGIPAILAGILTQLSLYSVNLKIMGKANQAINVDKYPILISLRRIKNVPITQNTILIVALFIVVIIAILYWFSEQSLDVPSVLPDAIQTCPVHRVSTLIFAKYLDL